MYGSVVLVAIAQLRTEHGHETALSNVGGIDFLAFAVALGELGEHDLVGCGTGVHAAEGHKRMITSLLHVDGEQIDGARLLLKVAIDDVLFRVKATLSRSSNLPDGPGQRAQLWEKSTKNRSERPQIVDQVHKAALPFARALTVRMGSTSSRVSDPTGG